MSLPSFDAPIDPPLDLASDDLERLAQGVRIIAGDAPVDALRAAKLAMKRQPGRGQPFNWAGFVLVGATARNPG